jgi:hypothetical protein
MGACGGTPLKNRKGADTTAIVITTTNKEDGIHNDNYDDDDGTDRYRMRGSGKCEARLDN